MTTKLVKDMTREEKKAHYAAKRAAEAAWQRRAEEEKHRAWKAAAEDWKRFVAAVSEKVKECEAHFKAECETPEFAAIAWASVDPEARRIVRLFALTLERDDSMEPTVYARSGLTRRKFDGLIETLKDLRVLLPHPMDEEPHLREYNPDLHFVSGGYDNRKFSGGGCSYDVGVAQELDANWRSLWGDPEPVSLLSIQAALYRAHGYILNPAIHALAMKAPSDEAEERSPTP